MRIVLVLTVFQFIAPAFLSVVSQGAEPGKETSCYHADHSSILVPLLLKEKEENEETVSDNFATIDLVPLIDFTDHSFALAELHENKFVPFGYRDRYDHELPLFQLHGSYLI